MSTTRRVTLIGLIAAVAPLAAAHPLDPLSFSEYWTVLKTLDAEGRLDTKTRFSWISLLPPPKDLVWNWDAEGAAPRSAVAVVRQGKESFEAKVDLVAGEITSWERLEGVQPNWLTEEFDKGVDKVLENAEFKAALNRRGIKNTAFVGCSAGPPGYYGTEEQRGRRVAYVRCNDLRDARNAWTRQIEGLSVVFDMDEEEVLRIVDEGTVPVPDTFADYNDESLGTPREVPGPIFVSQPMGAGYKLDGHVIEWQNWRFHARPDQRAGPIISTVTYEVGGRRRPILYEGHLSEMFVPYMDPSFHWYSRNFMDAGEFPAGGLLKPLLPGLDCPEYAYYEDALIHDDKGRPVARPNVTCIFERETGDMLWRHHSEDPESRKKRELVVRSVAVLGNYDYVFDWIFLQDGSIRVAVGATGIVETKMVEQATSRAYPADDGDGGTGPAPDAYGRFVDKHIVGVNHDHYFSFRLDLDVDGSKNEFVVDKLVQQRLPKEHPRRSVWVREAFRPKSESEGQLNIDLNKPRLWRVLSTTRRNHVGYPASYQLMPGRNTTTLLSEDDYPRRRARFIEHHLWVTPYTEDQRWAAGIYPTLSTPGMGLPEWTKDNRSIESTDVVLYHSIGMQHLVRAEDWPVMPTLWHSFELRPFDFFDRNPSMDLPK